MKRIKMSFLSLLIIVFSCSSDDTNENQVNDNENFRLIKEVTYSLASGGTETLKFAYENGRVVKENRKYQVYSINYESNRITEVLWCTDVAWDVDIDNYNCQGSESLFYSYEYENNRLVKIIEDLNQDVVVNINYDGNGRVISEIEDGNGEDVYYEYDGDNITMMTLSYQGSSSSFTFENDGQKNPFYPLWKVLGYKLYDLEFEPYNLGGCLFKENPKKIYNEDGSLRLEADYNYDEFGYPISCTFTKYSLGGATWNGTVMFTYLE